MIKPFFRLGMLMQRLFRPVTLLWTLMGLTLLGLLIVLPPWGAPPVAVAPRPVPEGDQEIVWLNTATNGVAWERLVAAVRQVAEGPNARLRLFAQENAFPGQTASVPEFAVAPPEATGRLWFRWYKITGETDTAAWVRALAARRPPPLAIVGGGSTDRARDLATTLAQLPLPLVERPLMLITTATSERVEVSGETRPLMQLYPGRSFRFCFTNRQMAEALTDFIWEQDRLRPDAPPVYGIRWEDDAYSTDLFESFHELLGPERFQGAPARAIDALARESASLVGRLAGGWLGPFSADSGGQALSFWSMRIPFSVGTFNRANRWESQAGEGLVDALTQNPGQRRALLVLPTNPQPAQRFLRAVARSSPGEAARFTVATGDALDFNTIYRDRRLKWPVQDLPFDLVLFCHRNPVEEGSFMPDRPDNDAAPNSAGPTCTGTQDLVLYRDITETVVAAAYLRSKGQTPPCASPDDLRAHLVDAARLPDGRPRFDASGDQPSGVGEYVVCLLPVRDGERVAPMARLQVWHRRAAGGQASRWERVRVAGQPELEVPYGSAPPTGTTP